MILLQFLYNFSTILCHNFSTVRLSFDYFRAFPTLLRFSIAPSMACDAAFYSCRKGDVFFISAPVVAHGILFARR